MAYRHRDEQIASGSVVGVADCSLKKPASEPASNIRIGGTDSCASTGKREQRNTVI